MAEELEFLEGDAWPTVGVEARELRPLVTFGPGRFERVTIDAISEGCNILYREDQAIVTVILKYGPELHEGAETPPSPQHSPAFSQLSDAIVRYVARTCDPDTTRSGRLQKPRLHVVQCDDPQPAR